MKKPFTFKISISILLLFICEIVFAQIPAGGSMLNVTTGTTYRNVGSGTLTQVNVTGQPFTKALRYVTGSNVMNFWDTQIQFPSAAGIATNDVILITFYARTISSVEEGGEGAVNVVIENATTYDKEISTKLRIAKEWKQYYASVKSKSTWTTAQVRYALFTGYPSQTIEVADVQFLNYKSTLTLNDLPITIITYPGQAADASWRAPAQERINQIRKGIADIIVYDEQGNAVPNASVTVEMSRHKFGFGTAIPASVFLSNTIFRNKVYELFNEVVFENDLKWPQFNPASTLNLRKSLDSLDRRKIAVRGHNVIWPSWKFLPTSLKTLETNPVALRAAIDKHIDEVTLFTKGRLNDWDVINEPYSEKDIMTIFGNEIMADWFKRVRNNDRTVKLYLNDYDILSGGGNNTKKQDSYFNLVKYIDENGAHVDGIGFQGHFGSDLTSLTKVYSIIDRFAALGKEIKITEHDINVTQRQVQADYTRDFMTICFSHEAVKSFLFWGFWANSHWLPEGALFNSDWTIRPHGEAYKNLVFNEWWTKKTDSLTNAEGKTRLEGFLGTFKYTIKSGDKVRTGTFEINNSKKSGIANSVILSFDTTIPDNVKITASKPACLCEGENIVLKTNAVDGLDYQWFLGDSLLTEKSATLTTTSAGIYSVKVKKGAIVITSPPFEVKVNPIPEAVISTNDGLTFCPGGKVKLSTTVSKDASYNWMKGALKINGSVSSIDVEQIGSYSLVASSNGCIDKSDAVNVQMYAANDPACITGIEENEVSYRVYPNPFKDSFVIETSGMSNEPVTAELFNTLGQRVMVSVLDNVSGKTSVRHETPGIYTLKISNSKEFRVFKIIGTK
jgi:GH35 family endo-1,4-beta-xylanase